VGLALPGPADDEGKFLTPSSGDDLLVALLGLALRLLADLAELPLEDLACILWVSADAETRLDQGGDKAGSRQLGPPAVLVDPLLEQSLELPKADRRGDRVLGRDGAWEKALGGFPVRFQPGVDGGSAVAEEAGNIVAMFSLFTPLNNAVTSPSEFLDTIESPLP
jgi:hypothetical protein